MPFRNTQQKYSSYCWLLPSHGNAMVFCVVSDTIVLSFLVSAFPFCPWQGVEKLVHYFSDKAWYSTISDFFPATFHHFSPPVCMMHVSQHEITGMLRWLLTIFFLISRMSLVIILVMILYQEDYFRQFLCLVWHFKIFLVYDICWNSSTNQDDASGCHFTTGN